MTSILDNHATLRQPYHERCGGTILGGDDGYRYCDTCGAFQHDPGAPMPTGTDPAANRQAFDAGEECSPDAAIAVINDGQVIYPITEEAVRKLSIARCGDGSIRDALAALTDMDGEDYGAWCGAQDLPCDLEVGTKEMGEYCQRLIDEGALYIYLDADRYVADRAQQRVA